MSANLNPYKQAGSVAFRTFEMAKVGTTKADLIKLFTKEDVGPARLLRELKLQDFRNLSWKYTETEEGKIKITNVVAKAAGKAPTKKAAKAKQAANKAATKKAAKKVVAKKAAPKKAAAKKSDAPKQEPAEVVSE